MQMSLYWHFSNTLQSHNIFLFIFVFWVWQHLSFINGILTIRTRICCHLVDNIQIMCKHVKCDDNFVFIFLFIEYFQNYLLFRNKWIYSKQINAMTQLMELHSNIWNAKKNDILQQIKLDIITTVQGILLYVRRIAN